MTDPARDSAKLVATYALALSVFSLAGALIYFTLEVTSVSRQIPGILASVDHSSDNVEPIINEIGEIRLLIPDILDEVEQTRKLVPSILEEVAQTREQIPPILKQVEQTRRQIPSILSEVKAVRKELPAVLASADKASLAVIDVAKEIEAARPLIPQVLHEVEITRESIPPMLDRADDMISKARVAGQEASSGAVSGFFKGLITTPFVLVGDAGKKISGMSDKEMKNHTDADFKLLEAAARDLLNTGKEGDTREVNNADSGYAAKIKLLLKYTKEGDLSTYECRTLQIESFKNGNKVKSVKKSLCKNDDDKWDFDD